MPELPEIETICTNLQQSISNYTIEQIIIRNPSLRWPINPHLSNILQNSVIKHIYRRAKYLLIACYNKNSGESHLIIHLGMSGKLSVVNQSTPVIKHDHVDFVLREGVVLRYNDPRRFGSVLWTNNNPLEHNLLAHLGPEPFDPIFNAKYLFNQTKNKNVLIKQLIMNNKIVVGVGNIYANEALFRAKIHPLSISKNLSLLHLKNLVMAIRSILKQAISKGGTTLKDFFDPTGLPGTFVNTLKVYGKANQNCLVCNTKISQVKLGQRSTFFCDNCQFIV